MAKKSSSKRVFQLAKELGVTSKDLIGKCAAEDIPGITNHMSTVSLGLAATIREWFGESGSGGTATAVEVAAPVDVVQARAKAKKKATRKQAKTADEAPPEVTIEVPPEAPPEVAEVAVETPAPAVVAEAPVASVEAAAPPPVDTPEAAPVAASAGAPTMNVPDRPQVVAPAGPMLEQPSKTKLSGPKVIRVETPDIVPPPRPRSAPRSGAPVMRADARSGRGAGRMPEPGEDAGRAARRGGAAGGGAGGGAAGGTASSRRNKRRTGTGRDDAGRTGRSSSTTPAAGGSRPFNWREQDLVERERRLSRAGGFFKQARRDNLKRSSAGGGHRAQSAAETGGTVKVEEPLTIKALSAASGVKVNDMIRHLVKSGHMITNADAVIETELAIELMLEHGIELEVIEQMTAEQQIVEQFKDREVTDEQPCSPVVTILGHVDHGKTSLLDRIRKTNVADGEAGGITQATSAFQVPVSVGESHRVITFIDTPGHEAFTEMRSRGAQVTDVVVLVVAADDGVMPQTIESINHARAADVPIVVALNKIDKAEATDTNIQRILGQLAEHELNPVEWGGSTEVVRTSAIKDEGIQDLLEILDYQAELLSLTADFGGSAEGTVIESKLEEGRGPVANVLVQQGKLRKGDSIVVGRAFGRVRDIINDHGKRIEEAGPSTPVAISGMNEVPDAGDHFYVVKNAKEAESAAAERKAVERERDLSREKVTLDNIFQKISESERKDLPLIVKADVQGSMETLKATLEKISTDDITISIKHTAVGGINDSDILLAEATGSIIIGFNVTATGKARKVAEAKGVDIRLYDVIYDITDDVVKAAEGLLEPEYKLEVMGHAEVREVFRVSKVGMIAGCYVTDGVIERSAQIRVTRDGIVVEKDRRLEQLKRFKDDAKEVRSGQECGMRIDGYDDIKEGDVLECYKTREVRRSL